MTATTAERTGAFNAFSVQCWLLLLCGAAVACGGSAPELPPLQPGWQAILQRARSQAERDSARLDAASLAGGAVMTFRFGRDTASVTVEDRFSLLKNPVGAFGTQTLSHSERGDSALLQDMYTFKDSKGQARVPATAQLGGLSFGADPLTLFRTLLAGGDGHKYALRDSASGDGGSRYHFAFINGSTAGEFWLGGDSCDVVRMQVAQQSDYWVGGYSYRMVTEYGRGPGNLLLPQKAISQFEYSRLTTKGTGSIVVVLDSMRAR